MRPIGPDRTQRNTNNTTTLTTTTKEPETMKTKFAVHPKEWGAAMLALAIVALPGCKDDEEDPPAPPVVNEEELITTVRLTMVPALGGDTAVFDWLDLDGDGGNTPIITGDTLVTGTVYNASLLLLNETENPADTISNEVADEAEAHQFFFATMGSGLTWTSYDDVDADGNPVGLASTWTTAGAGSGSISVVLRHEPDKTASGVSTGDITNAGGDTDIEVSIPFVVQ